MKRENLILLLACCFALVFTGCTSTIRVPPYPSSEPWGADVKRLGAVTATSGPWPLSLNSLPPSYTFQAALRSQAANQFGVPEPEIVVGEATVQIGAELDGTIRNWKATAEAGRRMAEATKAKSPSDSLIELKKLLDAGAITQGDYERKKKALLDKL